MAGIWDRIRDSGEGSDRVPVFLLDVAVALYASETIANKALILSKINEQIDVPLNFDAQSDLNGMADNFDGQPNAVSKLQYLLNIRAALLGAENDIITEAQFRTLLGI